MTTTNTNTPTNTCSYLELIIGPMFSGKTSRLIEIYKQCKFCNIPTLVINHSIDTRYDQHLLSNHDKVMIPCLQTTQLATLINNQEFKKAEVILINEGQFFDDLYDCTELWLKKNKKIYISGLDGDFERKKFGQIIDLIPLCDKVTKMTSLCSICKNGTPGIFSKRITKEKEQTMVGSDNYLPVCRYCYENKE